MDNPLLSEIASRLAAISDTPALDASVLVSHVINKPRTWVMAHPELTLTTGQQQLMDDSLVRLERGESFPYVLGHWEFFGLDFELTPDVLIPRPETELLVEKAIAWLQESPGRKSIADVGTGSGAIAISIASSVPDVRVLATDISLRALKVARRNASKHHLLNRIDFLQCDLLPAHASNPPQKQRLDLICANLPYIPSDTLQQLPIFGKEPTIALDGGPDGLDSVRRLLRIGPEWLAAGGIMLLEIEATGGIQARKLAEELFPEGIIQLHKDIAGQDRLLEIRL